MKKTLLTGVLLCLLVAGTNAQYVTRDSILIKTPEGATLSAMVVYKEGTSLPLPATLFFSIYTDPQRFLEEAKFSADRGYVAVIADARGKRLSTDEIIPYEVEGKDALAVIDWMSKQP